MRNSMIWVLTLDGRWLSCPKYEQPGSGGDPQKIQLSVKRKFRFRDIRIIRKFLLWLHDRIFTLYYEK
jgi:hypothetical protein